MLGLPIREIELKQQPFGYEKDPDKKGWLRPVQKQLEALYFSNRYRKRSTWKELARWISLETGRHISDQALRRIHYDRPPLAVYLLPLHDRIKIATAETEDSAKEKRTKAQTAQGRRNYENFKRVAKAAIARREQLRREKGGVSPESGATDGISAI